MSQCKINIYFQPVKISLFWFCTMLTRITRHPYIAPDIK